MFIVAPLSNYVIMSNQIGRGEIFSFSSSSHRSWTEIWRWPLLECHSIPFVWILFNFLFVDFLIHSRFWDTVGRTILEIEDMWVLLMKVATLKTLDWALYMDITSITSLTKLHYLKSSLILSIQEEYMMHYMSYLCLALNMS